GGVLVFQVAKAAPPATAAAVKKVAKRDAGLTIDPDFQLASDADAEEQVNGAPASAAPATGTPAAAAASTARPAPKVQANVAGIQKALQKLGYDPGKIDGIAGPRTAAAIKRFQKANGLAANGKVDPATQAALGKALKGAVAGANGAQVANGTTAGAKTAPTAPLNLTAWQSARQHAIDGLKGLATKIAMTKHREAAPVLKEINSIITRLLPKPLLQDIDKLEAFIRDDDAISAAEEVPPHVHTLKIREPLLKAL